MGRELCEKLTDVLFAVFQKKPYPVYDSHTQIKPGRQDAGGLRDVGNEPHRG